MVADQDHDGFVSQRELTDFSDFQHADLNHDGRIDPIEMRLFMANNQTGSRKYLFSDLFSHASFCFYTGPPPPTRHLQSHFFLVPVPVWSR